MLTKEEKLLFCSRCARKKDETEGLVLCTLTGEEAAFEEKCGDFLAEGTVAVPQPAEQESPSEEEEVQVLTAAEYAELKAAQNLPRGITVGIIVGVVCAVVWAMISYFTQYQIGYMAIALGAAVGFAIKKAGKGITPVFGIAGAIIAGLSCVLGNLLIIAALIGFGDFLSMIGQYSLIDILVETFEPIDALFYGLAIWEGYRFAFRKIAVV